MKTNQNNNSYKEIEEQIVQYSEHIDIPEELDFVIPGNDDAIRAVKLIVSKMADAVIEANQGVEEAPAEEAEAVEEA